MNGIHLPDSVDNAVKNLSDKPTIAIGQTIADLWQLVLGGRIAYAAEKQKLRYANDLEEYRKTLEEKADLIPEHKQIEPSLHIAAQALEDSKFCIGSKELRSLFANLITRSMNIDYADHIHPSFSKIIQQLTPLDAQMLIIFKKWHSSGGIAIVDYIHSTADGGYQTLLETVPAEYPTGVNIPSVILSINSLQHVGLIQVPEGLHFNSEARYVGFLQSSHFKKLETEAICRGYQIEIKKRIGKLSPLGEAFVNVCLD